MKPFNYLFGVILFALVMSCSEVPDTNGSNKEEVIDKSPMGINYKGSPMDSLIDFDKYNYEYRTERWNGYEYNFDIYGYAENGAFVYGNVNIIDMNDGMGTGYIYGSDAKDEDLFVIVHLTGKTKMTGVDVNELNYELEIFNCFFESSKYKFPGSSFSSK